MCGRPTRGLQACEIDEDDEDVYLNTCGTFGVTTAGYWWDRLGAGEQRLQHYLAGPDHQVWTMRVADDLDWHVEGEGDDGSEADLLFGLFCLVILDLPVSWHKTRGGEYIHLGRLRTPVGVLCTRAFPEESRLAPCLVRTNPRGRYD